MDRATPASFLRHLHESSPSSDEVGGFFFDFEPLRTRAGLFYEGLVVASRQGAPLTEPPSYGEASPALEHLVLYDDGSSEWLTLKNEKVRYVQATRAAQLVGQVTASLSADDDMDWFAAPVEAEALGLVDYHNVVSEPMDLGTVGDCVASKVQVVLQFEVCWGLREVLLPQYGRGYPSEVVSEFGPKT